MRISTLVIRGQEHGDFKVYRARAAICEVDTLIFQVLTLQVIKCWVGLRTRLGYKHTGPSGLAELEHTVSIGEVFMSAPNSNYT